MSCSEDPMVYTLTTTANPSEGGTVSPVTKQYNEGETAIINATPAAEYVFDKWTGATGSEETTIVMNSDKTVVANFVKKKYTLTVNKQGEGTVIEKIIKAGAATDYNSGTVVELTATPSGGWKFKEWNGDLTGTENPKEITIDKPKTVTAVFETLPPFYLDANGVTIKARDWVTAGTTGELGGVTYTAVDRDMLIKMLTDEDDVSKVVTTLVTSLEARSLIGGYGGADILHGCSVAIDKNEIVVIVGPNGAGKSTAMKAMLGMLKIKSGSVSFMGNDITKLSPQLRINQGLSFVPQTNNVFTELTVRENLEIGAYIRKDDFEETINQIYDLFPALKDKQSQLAGELSGGQRQQVAVGRALMTKPSVLMLDEPTAGVSPIVMDELFERIIEIKKTGMAILIVEQNAKQALNIADYGYVLVNGQNKHFGTGKELLDSKEVRQSFLGG